MDPAVFRYVRRSIWTLSASSNASFLTLKWQRLPASLVATRSTKLRCVAFYRLAGILIAMQCSRNKYVGPSYFRTEVYAEFVACCPLVSHGEYANGTANGTDKSDGQTDARPLHYAFRNTRPPS